MVVQYVQVSEVMEKLCFQDNDTFLETLPEASFKRQLPEGIFQTAMPEKSGIIRQQKNVYLLRDRFFYISCFHFFSSFQKINKTFLNFFLDAKNV